MAYLCENKAARLLLWMQWVEVAVEQLVIHELAVRVLQQQLHHRQRGELAPRRLQVRPHIHGRHRREVIIGEVHPLHKRGPSHVASVSVSSEVLP